MVSVVLVCMCCGAKRVAGGSAWVKVFGQYILLVSDGDLAVEMLGKKSLKYSSRPILQMGGELCQ